MEKTYNEHVSHLPKHLLQYVVDQNYDNYTSIDQAVWRYVMRQNVNYLPSVCHGSYLEGLKKTGLSTEQIPSMYGMTRILKDIGWFAVAVDGFIPPSAFMEFQAHNVLVIAADIRQINHIGYTPAPDILHEAAGHAPIIADKEYAAYLTKFGEIGSKAFSSSEDMEIFNAIRELSILKEAPNVAPESVEKAEKKVLELQSNATAISEMSKIRNLHWWTVEYGLIGSIDNHKIYGAGLLSSISESVNCLSDKVKKIDYTVNAANTVFDITKEQPQLFVAKDFHYLNSVLDEFSEKMAFKIGGDYALNLAIDSGSISTCEFDSGVQVSGKFVNGLKKDNHIIYIKTLGPTAISYNNKEILNHGIKHHKDGFGMPIGSIINIDSINNLNANLNEKIKINYNSGVVVEGYLYDSIKDDNGGIVMLSFKDCKVYLNEASDNELVLFDPSWGVFDLVIADSIVSAYPYAADHNSFPVKEISLSSHTIKPKLSPEKIKLNNLYDKIRNIREENLLLEFDVINEILETILSDYHNEWLLTLEICELVKNKIDDIYQKAYLHLMAIIKGEPSYKKLILDGLNIIK